MLPDRPLLIGQKNQKMPKLKKFKRDIFPDFKTLCSIIAYFKTRFECLTCEWNEKNDLFDF